MIRTAFVDDQELSHSFKTGDVVRKAGIRGLFLSPYSGRVIYSNTDLGIVHVQWPWGPEQEVASDLIKDTSETLAPPVIVQEPNTWESTRFVDSDEQIREDKKWRKSISSIVGKNERRIDNVIIQACKSFHHEFDDLESYMRLSSELYNEYSDDEIRSAISSVFDQASKVALYWGDSGRRYKTTQKERQTGFYTCPRCKGLLKPRTYRQGQRILLCRGCGFSIHPRDIK